jgi:hypothetical protein
MNLQSSSKHGTRKSLLGTGQREALQSSSVDNTAASFNLQQTRDTRLHDKQLLLLLSPLPATLSTGPRRLFGAILLVRLLVLLLLPLLYPASATATSSSRALNNSSCSTISTACLWHNEASMLLALCWLLQTLLPPLLLRLHLLAVVLHPETACACRTVLQAPLLLLLL